MTDAHRVFANTIKPNQRAANRTNVMQYYYGDDPWTFSDPYEASHRASSTYSSHGHGSHGRPLQPSHNFGKELDPYAQHGIPRMLTRDEICGREQKPIETGTSRMGAALKKRLEPGRPAWQDDPRYVAPKKAKPPAISAQGNFTSSKARKAAKAAEEKRGKKARKKGH